MSNIASAELEEIVEQLEGAENVRKISQQFSRKSSNQSFCSTKGYADESESKNVEDQIDIDNGIPMEATSKGAVKGSVSWKYFRSGAHWSIVLCLFLTFFLVQFTASAIDYWVSIWYFQVKIISMANLSNANYSFRTHQEEARTYQKTHGHLESNSADQKDHTVRFSTNFCVTVQGLLMASLLILGLAR